MQLEEKHTKFLDAVLGASGQKKKSKEDEEKKAKVLDETLNSLTDADKVELRKAMNFFAVDAKGNKTLAMDTRGQEYALDTEAANRKGLVVDPKTLKAVREQFDKIIQMVEKLRAAGFDAAEIADEIFTPLVREGILPENLVTDQYSEVQKLLGASYKSYKETLEEARQDEQKAKAKTQSDFHGAGSKVDMVKGLAGKAGELQERILDAVTPNKIGTKEDRARARDLAMSTYSAATSIYSSVGDVKKMASGDAVKEATDTLNAVKPPPTPPSTVFSEWGDKAAKVFDGNPALKSKFTEELAKAIKAATKDLDKFSDDLSNLQEEKWFEILSSTLSAVMEGVESGVESAKAGIELKSLKEELESAKSAEEIRKSAAEVVGKIDKAISEAVKKVDSSGGAAIIGAYAGSVEPSKIVAIAIEASPEGKDIVKELAAGFGAAFKMFGDDKAFEQAGKSMGATFTSEVNAPILSKAIKEDPKTAFDPVVESATKAVEKHAGDLKDKLSDPKARRAMMKNVGKKLEKGLEEKLKASEEDMAEYERQLVLMDEGDADAADQVSIEKLIAQLKADKATLELVVSLASGLTGLGSGATEIASKATEAVTEKLVGQVAGPLAAAKMIVQLSVNIINAADRWKLWYKFRAHLELSKKAVSALSSTIQGFYDNKKEQIAFHTIEDALLAVQIAGSIVGSIPEPVSMAVGKTLSSVAEAASAVNTVAGKVYNEVMLRKAWTTTKAAMDNPKDRSLGLAALRLNPTLSMHAIAWAALEKRDPIARVFLDACGLNEQTLADGGTTEKKVRDYLENYLDEDRKLKDTEQLKTNWQPKNITLSSRDWAIVQVRAAEKATPKLRKEDTSKIREALKKIEANGSLGLFDGKTELDKMGPEIFIEWIKDVDNALSLMDAYRPSGEDGTPHEDMSVLLAQFVNLAKEHKTALIRARNENLKINLAKANIRSQATGAQATGQSAGVLQEA
jgi:hypothetical protein